MGCIFVNHIELFWDALEQRVIAGAAAEQEVDLAALLNGDAPARSHGHDHGH
ncbi:hypothetical protein [Variovorax sp. RO1]|uniref:hypothetical protein n=1 Tax=Variovorax sp. RO1 TaxID=2066034 RepID=UPI0021508DCC|nr:hypothetical protein [Variovorax sp. RO1]